MVRKSANKETSELGGGGSAYSHDECAREPPPPLPTPLTVVPAAAIDALATRAGFKQELEAVEAGLLTGAIRERDRKVAERGNHGGCSGGPARGRGAAATSQAVRGGRRSGGKGSGGGGDVDNNGGTSIDHHGVDGGGGGGGASSMTASTQQQQQQQQQQPMVNACEEDDEEEEEESSSEFADLQLQAARKLRQLLSANRELLIQEVLERNWVPLLLGWLQLHQRPAVQVEALWALTNIAAGTAEHTHVLIKHGAVPTLVGLLSSPNEEVLEQALWVLGNLAGEGESARDCVLGHGVLGPLVACLEHPHCSLSMLRIGSWTLSNLCDGQPRLLANDLHNHHHHHRGGNGGGGSGGGDGSSAGVLGVLALLLQASDAEVLSHTCWALSHLCDGPSSHIRAVVEADVCWRLVQLLGHRSWRVTKPALRTIGNMVCAEDEIDYTQHILESGAVPCLTALVAHTNREIQKEACWTLSNIAAGTVEQIQTVLDSGAVPGLVALASGGQANLSLAMVSNSTANNKNNKTNKNKNASNAAAAAAAAADASTATTSVVTVGNVSKEVSVLTTHTTATDRTATAVASRPVTTACVDLEVRNEACWVVLNAVSCGSDNQIDYLVKQGCVSVLGELLQEPSMVVMALEGLERILQVGDEEAKRTSALLAAESAESVAESAAARGGGGGGRASSSSTDGEGGRKYDDGGGGGVEGRVTSSSAHLNSVGMRGNGDRGGGEVVGGEVVENAAAGRVIDGGVVVGGGGGSGDGGGDSRSVAGGQQQQQQAEKAAAATIRQGANPYASLLSPGRIEELIETHKSPAIAKRASRIWKAHFVTCAICSSSFSKHDPKKGQNSTFCSECKCFVCGLCDCAVFHLSYQEELWAQLEGPSNSKGGGGCGKGSKKQSHNSSNNGNSQQAHNLSSSNEKQASSKAKNKRKKNKNKEKKSKGTAVSGYGKGKTEDAEDDDDNGDDDERAHIVAVAPSSVAAVSISPASRSKPKGVLAQHEQERRGASVSAETELSPALTAAAAPSNAQRHNHRKRGAVRGAFGVGVEKMGGQLEVLRKEEGGKEKAPLTATTNPSPLSATHIKGTPALLLTSHSRGGGGGVGRGAEKGAPPSPSPSLPLPPSAAAGGNRRNLNTKESPRKQTAQPPISPLSPSSGSLSPSSPFPPTTLRASESSSRNGNSSRSSRGSKVGQSGGDDKLVSFLEQTGSILALAEMLDDYDQDDITDEDVRLLQEAASARQSSLSST